MQFTGEVKSVSVTKGKDSRVAKVTLQFCVESEETIQDLVKLQETIVKCTITEESL